MGREGGFAGLSVGGAIVIAGIARNLLERDRRDPLRNAVASTRTGREWRLRVARGGVK